MKKKSPQHREIVYGIHPVKELIHAKRRAIKTLYTVQPVPRGVRSLIQEAPRVQYVDRAQLSRIAGSTDHQSVVALAEPFPFRTQPFTPKKEPVVVLLDGIQDPRNVGAIIRTAFCTGTNGVILPAKGSPDITGTVLKASAGLAERLPIFQPRSTAQAISQLTSAGYTLWYGALEGISIVDASFEKPICMVIGSEGTGVSSATREAARAVHIPQRSADVSYNASVAAGILLFSISLSIPR